MYVGEFSTTTHQFGKSFLGSPITSKYIYLVRVSCLVYIFVRFYAPEMLSCLFFSS